MNWEKFFALYKKYNSKFERKNGELYLGDKILIDIRHYFIVAYRLDGESRKQLSSKQLEKEIKE